MVNAIIKMIQVAAPLIHQNIVRTLSNSITFQRLAWHGTEAVKKTAKEGSEAVKSSAAYRTAQYKAMEQMQRLKQTEAFKEVESSGALRKLMLFKDELVKELKRLK